MQLPDKIESIADALRKAAADMRIWQESAKASQEAHRKAIQDTDIALKSLEVKDIWKTMRDDIPVFDENPEKSAREIAEEFSRKKQK